MHDLTTSEFWIAGLTCYVMVLLATAAMGPLMWALWKIVDFIVPGCLTKQIRDDKNIAAANVAGCMFIGMSIIVAAIVHKLL